MTAIAILVNHCNQKAKSANESKDSCIRFMSDDPFEFECCQKEWSHFYDEWKALAEALKDICAETKLTFPVLDPIARPHRYFPCFFMTHPDQK